MGLENINTIAIIGKPNTKQFTLGRAYYGAKIFPLHNQSLAFESLKD